MSNRNHPMGSKGLWEETCREIKDIKIKAKKKEATKC